MVKRLSRILDMDESAVQLCAELPFFGSVVKRLSHILHMDGSTVQLCPELPILTRFFCMVQRWTRVQKSLADASYTSLPLLSKRLCIHCNAVLWTPTNKKTAFIQK